MKSPPSKSRVIIIGWFSIAAVGAVVSIVARTFEADGSIVSTTIWLIYEVCALAAAMVLATLEFRRWVWLKRIKAGLCPKCGYDLRASSNRCPECGQTIDG